MKCIFCDKLCIASDLYYGTSNYSGYWFCHNHPCLVKFESSNLGRHSIYAFNGVHWYEFSYNQLCKYYVLYCLDDHMMPSYEDGIERLVVNRVMAKDAPTFENITPENAQAKLSMILVFL